MNQKTFIGLLLVAILYSFGTVVIHVHQAMFVNSRVTYSIYCEGLKGDRELLAQNMSRQQAVVNKASFMAVNDNTETKSISSNTMVVIHSYQRSGSTFFGDMFNHHPDVYYQYEPLDALYSHLYGTEFGWNVPDDLFFYENGTLRNLTDTDIHHVTEYLEHLLTCQVDKLPTELLAHVYMADSPDQFISISDFANCSVNITKTKVNVCKKDTIPKYCGMRYGMVSESRMHTCNQLLNNPNAIKTDEPVNNTIRQAFKDFERCNGKIRRLIDGSCTDKLLYTCHNKAVRASKLVRASMKSTGKLLSTLPNLYVIHLMRDPRGVAMSRWNYHASVMGKFSLKAKSDKSILLLREAKMYCYLGLNDIIEREKLEKKYPGRVMSVMYEDFVKDIPVNIRKIYDFIKQPLNEKAFNQIYNKMSNKTQKRNTDVNRESSINVIDAIRYFKSLKLLSDDSMKNLKVNRKSEVISKTRYLETVKLLNHSIIKTNVGLNRKPTVVDKSEYLNILKLLNGDGPSIIHRHHWFRSGRNKSIDMLTMPSSENSTELPPFINIATKWQQKIGEAVNDQILIECREFYEKIKLGVKL